MAWPWYRKGRTPKDCLDTPPPSPHPKKERREEMGVPLALPIGAKEEEGWGKASFVSFFS